MLHLGTPSDGAFDFARLSTLQDLLVAHAFHRRDYERALEMAVKSGCDVPAQWADLVVQQWRNSGACVMSTEGVVPPLRGRVRAFNLMLRTGAVGMVSRFEGSERGRRLMEGMLPSRDYRREHGRTRVGQVTYLLGKVAPRHRSFDGAGESIDQERGDFMGAASGSPPFSILLMSTADWDRPLWTNKQHLAVQLNSKFGHLDYVNSIALRRPEFSRTDLRRTAQKLISLAARKPSVTGPAPPPGMTIHQPRGPSISQSTGSRPEGPRYPRA